VLLLPIFASYGLDYYKTITNPVSATNSFTGKKLKLNQV